jgi:EAL domain-containing protein (putative c-di-GMP-specific phosphodiesterase class I)
VASFVAQMRASKEARKIVESTTALSRKLGLTIVAGGVEDGQTLGLLDEAGCDFAQGYFISRPMPRDAVRPWLRRYEAHPSIRSSWSSIRISGTRQR